MKKEVEKFYDEFAAKQLLAAEGNERHRFLFRFLRREGLKSDSCVLELGCGIGAITSQMARIVKKGKIIALDISSESIEIAKKKGLSSHIHFLKQDLVNVPLPEGEFDFITLFDVIEHIPFEYYPRLFCSISERMKAATKLIINIPNPLYLEFLRSNHPDSLQVIDQPVYADLLMHHIYANKLMLRSFQTYDVWVKDEYQVMVILKKQDFREDPVSRGRFFKVR